MKRVATILLLLCSLVGFGQQHYPLGDQFGVVVHAWDIDSANWPLKYKAFTDAGFSHVRIYSDVYVNKDSFFRRSDLKPMIGYALNPDLRGFHQDASLNALRRDVPGLKTIFCYQNQSKVIQKTWPQGSTIDRPYYLSPDDTTSYNELRQDAFVLASRGGTNVNAPDYTVYESPYFWEPRQVMYKGAGFYDIVEYMNEPDMEYTFNRLTGAQVAIANSATYDGAKAADPNIFVSSSGCADGKVAKLDSIAAWCVRFRNGKLPFNVYQYHAYAFGWTYGMAGGIPPEYELLPNAIEIATHAAKYGVQAGVGEAGYDLNPKSTLSATIQGYDQDHAQAIFSLRTSICFSRAGIAWTTHYHAFYDYNLNRYEQSGNLFASMAFFKDVNEDNTNIVRRLQCDYNKQMKDNFGAYVYQDAKRDDTVKIYRFTFNQKEVYPAWTYEKLSQWQDSDLYHTTRPLNIERKVDVYFPAGTIYRPGDYGVMTQEVHPAGNITLTSTPIFFVPGPVSAPLPVHLISFTADKFTRSVILKWIVQDAAKVEVEKSTDGRTWINLGEGIFNKLVDMNPAYGKNYYRLKMYEQDGSFTYSFIITIPFATAHQRVNVFNVAGQLVKSGWSEDADKMRADLPRNMIFYFKYDSITETFIRQ
jgi:hypothetical protein